MENFKFYKVFVPNANGTGAIGEVLSTPLIGHTESFNSIGMFDNIFEAESVLKYVKTKFTRTMLGTLKITQHNPPPKWANVPMQDFTENSDIDWTKTVDEIDEQLFDKYELTENERNFIKKNIKKME